MVDGEFVLDDANEGGGPSQPEVVSPHGDRAQCECVHLVTVQRWDPEAEAFYPRRQSYRCTTFVGDADFEFGWRHCTRCRPPWEIVVLYFAGPARAEKGPCKEAAKRRVVVLKTLLQRY